MRIDQPTQLNRRHFLRGTGTCVALPLLESLLPRSCHAVEAASRAPRLAVFSMPFGMVEDKFHPKSAGPNYKLPATLEPLHSVKDDFTVFSNLDHDVRGGHVANHTFLSGISVTERSEFRDGNLTIDQRAAEILGNDTRFRSLNFWKEGMSFTRSGVRVPAITKPSDAFRLMFVDDTETQKNFKRASLKSRHSILDAVREDAKKLQKTLSSEDQGKLDEYLTSIRETEKKLDGPEVWIDRPKPSVTDPDRDKINSGEKDEKTGGNFVEVWLDLMFLALQTGSSRVVSVAGDNCSWGLEGVHAGYHQLSHHGLREEPLRQLAIVETYLMTHLGKFIERLKETKQADGSSLLNSTQVLFGSGLGSGSRHTNENLPVILAGGGYRHGTHIDGQRKQPLCNLFLTMLQKLGAEQDQFNKSTGTFNGIV